jgi:2-polyprenyl-3-methyl-5-hydroxy-6-metoxy-1,4-benzoquinol methylase
MVARKYKNNFRTLAKAQLEQVEAALRTNYFTRFPTEYLSTEWGRNDLENHLYRRLNSDRNTIVPWLDGVRQLKGASILEIGCGTGCSTVALAEQGARVIAVDVDENSLNVATERCRAYGLDVQFAQANATEAHQLFEAEHFDYIIFYAALEHMTSEERLSAMRATWQMLTAGSLWCVIDTPNRLWYYDAHTSLLPFHMWLPDELAFAYSRFSPRRNYRELYREYTDEARLDFLRRGRGVSFHEFELAMKPLKSLQIKSSLNLTNRKRGLFGPVKWRRSPDYRYISLLRSIAPDLHEGFLQSFLNLIVEKD